MALSILRNSLLFTTSFAVDLMFNPLNAELNPICHMLALLGAHPLLHVSRIRVKLLLAVTNKSGDNLSLFPKKE